jgi:hypothetical protein
MKLRPNSGIIIEGSHANRYLRTLRPVAAKQARAAVHTESFHGAFAFSINFNQLFALQQAKLFFSHARLGTNGRSRMFAATIAMTMTGADKGRIDFETNPSAKTTASDNFLQFQTVKRNSFAGDLPIVSQPLQMIARKRSRNFLRSLEGAIH